ncbi:MAG: hypothetical protein S4CHLAM81_15200 [Chlamydiales bacterium]|nr:hypothetical protein [Chlamydiales bacterium]MCH9636289.1 hypothetical protein [Chlamydiales bacterium]
MRKRRSFTLLEIVLALALVAFATTALCLAIPAFLSKQRFEKEVLLVEQKLALVQELVFDCDMAINLVIEGNQLSIDPGCSLPKRWIRNPKPFSQIKQIAFDGQTTERLELQFDNEVGGCPRGELTLIGKRQQVTLSLLGYPGKIVRGREALYGKNAPYPQELLSHS